MAPKSMEPVVELPLSSDEYGDSRDIDPATATSSTNRIFEFISASEEILGAGTSEGPGHGANYAIVQSEVPSGFLRNEQEEEEAWKAQYNVGTQIQDALSRAFQLHQKTDFLISKVSTFPWELLVFYLVLVCSTHAPPLVVAEGNLAQQKHQAGPVVLPGALAWAVQCQFGRSDDRGQHLGDRPGGAPACAGGGAGADRQRARRPKGCGGAEGPGGRGAGYRAAAEGAELQREKVAVATLTSTLGERDAALPKKEAAARSAEAALKEKEDSLSTLQEQANAAVARLEEAQGDIKGEYMRFLLRLILDLPKTYLYFLVQS
jgi:hypothetical protein